MNLEFTKITKNKTIDYMKNYLDVEGGVYTFSYSKVIDFSNILSFESTSNITDMTSMFASCEKLERIPLFDTSNVTNMTFMFENCKSLTTIPCFNMSKVVNTSYMFNQAYGLTTLPQLDFSNIENMTSMFFSCENLIEAPYINALKATQIKCLFRKCKKLISVEGVECPNATDLTELISNCDLIERLGSLKAPNATTMTYMCYGDRALQELPEIDMINVTNAYQMIYECSSLTKANFQNLKIDFTLSDGSTYGTLLTLDSLVNTCKGCINTGSSKTLTVGATHKATLEATYVRLTNEPEKDANNPKLPCEVCESTDEGAMTVVDYMASKNWTLA